MHPLKQGSGRATRRTEDDDGDAEGDGHRSGKHGDAARTDMGTSGACERCARFSVHSRVFAIWLGTPERLAKSARCADHHFALVRMPAVGPHDFGAMHAPLLSVECPPTRLHESVVKAALVVAPLESFGVDMSKEPVEPLDARTAVKSDTLQRQCVVTIAVRALFSCTLTRLPSLNRRRDRVHVRSDANFLHTLMLQGRRLL